MTSKRENKTAGPAGPSKKRKASSSPSPRPSKRKPAPPTPAAVLPEEEFKKLRAEIRKEIYQELGRPEPRPAAAEQAQELTPVQRMYRDELLGQLQKVKKENAEKKAEKRALEAQLAEVKENIKACEERYVSIVAKLKSI